MMDSNSDSASAETTSSKQQDPVPKKRGKRLRRLCLRMGLAGIVMALAAGFFRLELAAWLLSNSLPQLIQGQTGLSLQFESLQVLEPDDTPLLVELQRIKLHAEDNSVQVSLDSLVIELEGWTALTQLSAIRKVLLNRGVIHLAINPNAAAMEHFPIPMLPESLPTLPFPVLLNQLDIIRGEEHWRTSFRLSDQQLELSAVPLGPQPTIKSFSLRSRIEQDGIYDCKIVIEPHNWLLEGQLVRKHPSAPYIGSFSAQQHYGTGQLKLTLPTHEEQLCELEISASITRATEWAQSFGYQGAELSEVHAKLLVDAQSDKLNIIGQIQLDDGLLQIDGKIRPNEIDLKLEAQQFALGPWVARFGNTTAIDGLISTELAITGPLQSPRFQSRGTLEDWSYDLKPSSLRGSTLKWSASLAQQKVELHQLTVGTLGGRISGGGQVYLDDSPSQITLSFSDLDLAQTQPWLDWAREIQGRAEGRLHLTGPGWKLSPTAQVSISEGMLAPKGWSNRLREFSAELRWQPQLIEVRQLRSKVAGGQISGHFKLNSTGPDEAVPTLTAELQLQRVQLLRTADIRLRTSGKIQLQGSVAEPKLSGSVEVVRGIYDRNFFPRASGRGGSMPFDLFSIEEGFLAKTEFDLNLNCSGSFLVRNNILDVAPHGRLHLGGTGKQPILTGALTATAGKVQMQHLTLEIQHAEVRFPSADPFNPQIEFLGRGDLAKHSIDVQAVGPLMNPKATFGSVPYQTEEDLLLLVATGYSRAQLGEQQLESVAAVEVLRLYGPEVWEKIFGRQRGESLLDRVSFSTETGSGVDQDSYVVEIRLNSWLSVAGEQDKRGEFNFDIKVFRWLK